MNTFIAALVAAIFMAAPLAASAQDYGPPPSYSGGGPTDNGDGNIHGRILNFDGAYALSVRDDQGYVDNVQLHQGTIINPTGLTLAPGMVVSILGYNAGPFFAANEVDTPYTFYAGAPYYQGHPWNYYGPSVSLGFFFGNTGWWHGGFFGGGFRSVGGARYYNNVHVNTTYRGGTFQGRNYVAPASRGGYVPRGQAQNRGSENRGGGNRGGGNNGGRHN